MSPTSTACRLLVFASGVLLGVTGASRGHAQPASKPNILFLFADDQSFDTIHALGNTEVQTPNLDRLVSRGVTFTHAHNMGGWHGAVCVASRTMLVTGRFLWKARNDENKLGSDYLESGQLWPQLLEKAGYETYFTGKWHVKVDATRAFKVTTHIRGGMPKQTPQGYNRPRMGEEDPWKPWDRSFGGFWEGGRHWSEVLGDDAVSFIETASRDERPFFMYLAFNAPHDPRQSPKEYVDRYPLERISVPEPFYRNYPYEIGSNKIRDEQLAPFPRTEYAVKVNRQEYYAIITHMDAQIGRILDALEKSGKARDTYIFFTADHGLACGHHGLMGKQNMFDHSVRVPLIVAGRDLKGGRRIASPVYLQDIMPTTLDLAGVDIPPQVEFHSLLPLLRPGKQSTYESIYGAYVMHQRMVTARGYKLITYPRIGRTLLYNLTDDPLETTDLAELPESRARIAELLEELRVWQERTGDELDLENPDARRRTEAQSTKKKTRTARPRTNTRRL